jgi:hypothetical protein
MNSRWRPPSGVLFEATSRSGEQEQVTPEAVGRPGEVFGAALTVNGGVRRAKLFARAKAPRRVSRRKAPTRHQTESPARQRQQLPTAGPAIDPPVLGSPQSPASTRMCAATLRPNALSA